MLGETFGDSQGFFFAFFSVAECGAEEMESDDNCTDPFGGRAKDLTQGSGSSSPIVHENN
jgi:hypothetical protein